MSRAKRAAIATTRRGRPVRFPVRRPSTERPSTRVLTALLVALALGACASSGSEAVGRGETSSAWQSTQIVDTAGQSFSIDELRGRPVVVETFTLACRACRDQLRDTQLAAAQAGDAATFVALSVDPDDDPEAVGEMARTYGLDDLRTAVASPAMIDALRQAYGATSLNPNATPIVVVAPEGATGELLTGRRTPDDLLERVADAG